MFTGIIEEKGFIEAIKWGPNSARLKIRAQKVLEGLKQGDSININGACLTVTTFNQVAFEVDVMAETMRSTNLGDLKTGQEVNMERALLFNGRLGGHLVSGHIDGTGMIEAFRKEDIATWVQISAPESIMQFIINKGSVALDGISLTISAIHDDGFSVSLIPHTASNTTLLNKKPGDKVNVECDLVAKYIQKFLANNKPIHKKALDYRFLKEHGFTD
ncbi:MAG: riboflavin synthase [Bacteroidales bacterium]